MTDRILSLLVALSLALLVWLYARSRDQEILDNVPVPVRIELAASQADNYSLELNGAAQVTASFSGPPLRIRELRGVLQRGELTVDVTLTVPDERLNESRYSDTIVVEASDLHAPPGVTAIMVEGRNRIPVTLHRLAERALPVRFQHADEDEAAGPVLIDPPTVLVRGPKEVLDRTRVISTQASGLPARPANAPPTAAATARVPLVPTLEDRPVRITPPKVTITVPAQPRKVYELPDVPVQFLCPGNFPLRPRFIGDRAGQVTLRLQGPVQDEPPKVVAYIDLTRGHFPLGRNFERLQLQLPKDFVLAQDPPREVPFELLPAEFAPKGFGGSP
jgi:hypothetical protein